VRPTYGTEPAVHDVSAVGDERELFELDVDSQRRCVKDCIDGATSAADRLTDPAPARPRRDRCLSDPVAYCLTQASTRQFHETPFFDFTHPLPAERSFDRAVVAGFEVEGDRGAALSADTKSQAERRARSSSAREILDKRISTCSPSSAAVDRDNSAWRAPNNTLPRKTGKCANTETRGERSAHGEP
jgi:hypothetical protein